MVRHFFRCVCFPPTLSHADSPPSSSATFLSVSAKDVLLDEASSSLFGRRDFFDMEGVARESGAGSGQLLIIDDLDVVIGDVDEAGSSPVESDLESEQLRALDAIVRLVGGAANGAPSRRCFVLGEIDGGLVPRIITRPPLRQSE